MDGVADAEAAAPYRSGLDRALRTAGIDAGHGLRAARQGQHRRRAGDWDGEGRHRGARFHEAGKEPAADLDFRRRRTVLAGPVVRPQLYRLRDARRLPAATLAG